MIFAAGKGTRLKPLTDVIPKALVPVGDIPLIQRVYRKVVDAGADRVVVNVHHHAQQLKNYCHLLASTYGVKIEISDESDRLLETGGGIKKARQWFSEPVLIHNCDILSNTDLKAFYEHGKNADASSCQHVSPVVVAIGDTLDGDARGGSIARNAYPR